MLEYVPELIITNKVVESLFFVSQLLNVLVERYFEPLRHESYLSQLEVC